MTGFESCRWTNSLQLFNSQSDPWQCVRESWTMAARSCLVSRDGRHWCSCCSLRLCVIFGVLKGNRAQSFNLHLHLPPARSSRQVAEFLDHPSPTMPPSVNGQADLGFWKDLGGLEGFWFKFISMCKNFFSACYSCMSVWRSYLESCGLPLSAPAPFKHPHHELHTLLCTRHLTRHTG